MSHGLTASAAALARQSFSMPQRPVAQTASPSATPALGSKNPLLSKMPHPPGPNGEQLGGRRDEDGASG